jgi:hypothetical protein
LIAACGSGRSTSVIPAVPAAWSVTTIAFMGIASSVICLFGGNVAGMESPFPFDIPSAGLIGRGRPIWTASAGLLFARRHVSDLSLDLS